MEKVYKFLKFLSIHDVLTSRADLSDPTNNSDNGVQPAPVPTQEFKKQKLERPIRGRPVEQAPNLHYMSIHDVLTSRADNSDPTGKKDKRNG